MDSSRPAVGMRASWRKASIVSPSNKPARFYAESPGQFTNGRHMRFGFVEFDPIQSIDADASFVGQLPLGQCLLGPQIFELVSDVDHDLHCSHLLTVWLPFRCAPILT